MYNGIYYYDDYSDEVVFDDDAEIIVPGICGQCHLSGKQEVIYALKTGGINDDYYGIMFTMCHACQSITVHYLNAEEGNGVRTYQSDKSVPSLLKNSELSDYIKNEFPKFCAIYEQAKSAEEYELDLITGMAYRKSIEFLVSEYLLKFEQDSDIDEKWVSSPKVSLGQKIGKINDEKLQTLAKAISWIGNDETHFSRQNPEYNVDSMKGFIHALIGTIEYNKQFADAQKLINKD